MNVKFYIDVNKIQSTEQDQLSVSVYGETLTVVALSGFWRVAFA